MYINISICTIYMRVYVHATHVYASYCACFLNYKCVCCTCCFCSHCCYVARRSQSSITDIKRALENVNGTWWCFGCCTCRCITDKSALLHDACFPGSSVALHGGNSCCGYYRCFCCCCRRSAITAVTMALAHLNWWLK